jgi:hypothetical protein
MIYLMQELVRQVTRLQRRIKILFSMNYRENICIYYVDIQKTASLR